MPPTRVTCAEVLEDLHIQFEGPQPMKDLQWLVALRVDVVAKTIRTRWPEGNWGDILLQLAELLDINGERERSADYFKYLYRSRHALVA